MSNDLFESNIRKVDGEKVIGNFITNQQELANISFQF